MADELPKAPSISGEPPGPQADEAPTITLQSQLTRLEKEIRDLRRRPDAIFRHAGAIVPIVVSLVIITLLGVNGAFQSRDSQLNSIKADFAKTIKVTLESNNRKMDSTIARLEKTNNFYHDLAFNTPRLEEIGSYDQNLQYNLNSLPPGVRNMPIQQDSDLLSSNKNKLIKALKEQIAILQRQKEDLNRKYLESIDSLRYYKRKHLLDKLR